MAELTWRFEDRVNSTLKRCEERKETSAIWRVEISKCVMEEGLRFPSIELGEIIVDNLCFKNNNPSLWKFVGDAIVNGLVSSLHVLALLTKRILPSRGTQPEAYRLYLELLCRYLFFSTSAEVESCKKILMSVDDALELSLDYGVPIAELGQAMVLFLFSVVVGVIDCTFDDWGLNVQSIHKFGSTFGQGHEDMEVDYKENHNNHRKGYREELQRTNPFAALDVLGKLTESRKSMILLRLVYLNMPEKFNGLLQRLQFAETNKLASSYIKSAHHQFVRLSSNVTRSIGMEYQLNNRQLIGMLIGIGSFSSASCCNFGAGRAACWIPFDIYMETSMDGKHIPASSAVDVLTELTKTLQAINRASWQETFQALWISALRLVQRGREPLDGPIPHIDARLCILLSITPLAINNVMEHEECIVSGQVCAESQSKMGGMINTCKKQGLISSLQALGQFSCLLYPPASLVVTANNAAGKAAQFLSNLKNGNDSFSRSSRTDTCLKADGNMLHLIVEACIARKIIDTSVYSWPGYVSASVTSSSDPSLVQGSSWSTFMDGAKLAGPLKSFLISTPASSLVEIEKLYHIALNGREEDRSAAAKVLCGASLSRGWNIQEYVLRFVVKLLSPPVPPNFTGSGSHLIDYMSMLNTILLGMASVDIVHILSLHGMVPEIAASLLPLCEAFGSLLPSQASKPNTSDDISTYSVFSCAFLFLLRLWKFYKPPHEHCIIEGGGFTGFELTLEYLLTLRNSRIAPDQAVYIDSFPKLRAWYCQNKACIASTLSGLCSGNPVHEVANKILKMIYWKMNKGRAMSSNLSTTSSGSLSGSPLNATEEPYDRPTIPAWEVLEAIPLVLEAILTACAHERLSSRDLTTGLRDLVDFLPASIAAIISYLSAEITRGIWKPVTMNGIDWPSPAANLLLIESEINQILTAVGVTVPNCSAGDAPVMLPLPVAVLVSLTITFRLDKNSDHVHSVVGPALENCAAGCPWPTMTIIGALWAQKVKRLHDFVVVTCSRSSFKQDKVAVAQLIRSCFTSFLGSPQQAIYELGIGGNMSSGVDGLLGSIISVHTPIRSIAPGFLYLRTCRTLHHAEFVNDLIVGLVSELARESAFRWAHANKNPAKLKSSQASLALAVTRAKEVATLGASLLCVTGGVQLIQLLYKETIPTWLLSTREEGKVGMSPSSPMSCILEGYSMAYLLILSGSAIWGAMEISPSRAFGRRARIVGRHMDFIAGALEGNISLGCDPATWKAYVSCFVGLLVSVVPSWIREVKPETLKKLANGLRGWHECELALSLLERGGVAAMGSVAELVHLID